MIGIISAMQEEMQALLDKLENVSTTKKGMRTYYSGILFTKKVVLVFSRWGKVASAVTTTQLINDFELEEIIFTGVAGGIVENLEIGDIVIGNKMFQHDLDARPFYEQFEIPILKLPHVNTSKSNTLLEATKEFLNNYFEFVNEDEAHIFNIHKPKMIHGDIASGDQFISSLEKIKILNKMLPSATCVEMEGAAIAQVCYEYEVPFSIIRIISDKANDNANIDFVRFSDAIASNYALGILKNYFA